MWCDIYVSWMNLMHAEGKWPRRERSGSVIRLVLTVWWLGYWEVVVESDDKSNWTTGNESKSLAKWRGVEQVLVVADIAGWSDWSYAVTWCHRQYSATVCSHGLSMAVQVTAFRVLAPRLRLEDSHCSRQNNYILRKRVQYLEDNARRRPSILISFFVSVRVVLSGREENVFFSLSPYSCVFIGLYITQNRPFKASNIMNN